MLVDKKVIVKKDLKISEGKNKPSVTAGMVALAGKLASIVKVDIDGVFIDIDNGDFLWPAETLKVINEKDIELLISKGNICKKCYKTFYDKRCGLGLCIGCQNEILKSAISSILNDLGSIEETGDPQIDSYTDSAIKTARQALKECE